MPQIEEGPQVQQDGEWKQSVDHRRFDVAQLSVQPEGDFFLVGNSALGFYQFPEEGVLVLDLLRAGNTPEGICRQAADEPKLLTVDVDDFVATLHDIRFIAETGGDHPADAPTDKRWLFDVAPATASRFFAAPAMIAYGVLIGTALVCCIAVPTARPRLDAFFLDSHLALTLVLLLLLSSLTTALHELGHLLAAAREGVTSRLGIGNRLWNIVVEADLSGIMGLPRRRRYLPLLAGMAVDILSISAVTVALAWISLSHGNGFIVSLLQALVLQLLMTLSWQFNVFLRTDVYYVLSTAASYPNLDSDARRYVGHLAKLWHRDPERWDSHPRLKILRIFAGIWVVGRILSLGILFAIVLPTLTRYCLRAWRSFTDPHASSAEIWDSTVFALLSLCIVTVGMVVWLRPKISRAIGARRHANGEA